MALTRLFIIGAPKCGTTSLARWLAAHPEIHMSSIKEPHYYNVDMACRKITSKEEYEMLFSNAPRETKVLAEASAWYLYSDAAVPNILSDHPRAKLIAMTRDPVQMAISLYYHNRFKGHEPLDTIEAAWAAQERRALGEDLPRNCREPALLQYRTACALGDLVERLRNRVPEDQLLVLPLESLRANTRTHYQEVLEFIGVTDDGRVEFPVYNQASQQRSKLLSQIIQISVIAKRWLGIKTPMGLTSVNRVKLPEKAVSTKQLKLMQESFSLQVSKLHDLEYRGSIGITKGLGKQ